MVEILEIVISLIWLYIYVLIGSVILSWLMALGIINYHNNIVRSIWQTFQALTEPVLGPIRRAMPNTGALDLSPLVLLVGLQVVIALIHSLQRQIG